MPSLQKSLSDRTGTAKKTIRAGSTGRCPPLPFITGTAHRRFKFAINELDAWGMVGGAARNEAEHAVVCGRSVIPRGEPGEGFVRLAFNMRWGWQDDPKV